MAAHRYWRIKDVVQPGGASFFEISEFQLYYKNSSTSSSATITSSDVPTQPLGGFNDGSVGTRCYWTTAVATAVGFWVQWDFGAGNAKSVDGVRWAAWDTNGKHLTGVTVEYSDDGSAWTVAGSVSGMLYPGNSTHTEVYLLNPADPYWNNVTFKLQCVGANGATTFTDAKGHTITANGAAQIVNPLGKFGQTSLNLTGANSYLSIPDAADLRMGTSNHTIEAWVRLVNGAGGSIFYKGNYSLFFLSNTLYLQLPTNAINVLSWAATSIIGDNLFHHIAVTRWGNLFTLYVDGTAVATGSSGVDATDTVALWIGRDVNTSYLNGYIDDLTFTKGVCKYRGNFTPDMSAQPESVYSSDDPFLNNVVLRMPMDGANNGTTFTDVVGHTFTVGAGSPVTDTGLLKYGTASYANPASSYIQTADSPDWSLGTGDFTIEMWCNVDTLPSAGVNGFLLAQIGAFQLYINGDTHTLHAGGTPQDINTTLAWTTGVWRHVAYVRGGSLFSVYINGVLEGSATNSAGVTESANVLTIGGRTDGNYLRAHLDDIRITKGVARYQSNFTPPGAALPTTELDPYLDKVALLLHGEGTNGSTTITDSAGAHTITATGNAQISTTQFKYGSASVAFDGTGDYISTPSAADLQLGSLNYTIEGFVRFAAWNGNSSLFRKTGEYELYFDANQPVLKINGASNAYVLSWTPSVNTWYHFAVVRYQTTAYFFADGALIGTGTAVNITDGANAFEVGRTAFGLPDLNGYIDEFRVTKGVARYTSAFTPPQRALPDGAPTATFDTLTLTAPLSIYVYEPVQLTAPLSISVQDISVVTLTAPLSIDVYELPQLTAPLSISVFELAQLTAPFSINVMDSSVVTLTAPLLIDVFELVQLTAPLSIQVADFFPVQLTAPLSVYVYHPVQLTAPLSIQVVAGSGISVYSLYAGVKLQVYQAVQLTAPLSISVIGYTPLQLTASLSIDVYPPAFSLTVPLSVTVFTPGAPSTRAQRWRPQVVLNGVDVSSALTGTLSVDAIAGAARVAHFTLKPALGSVDLTQWVNSPVTVSYQKLEGSTWISFALFTGRVDSPEYDPTTRLSTFTCSDFLQRRFEGMTRAQISAELSGTHWSSAIYGEPLNGWEYAKQRMETQPYDYDLDVNGNPRYTAWYSTSPVDFTYDETLILDESLKVTLASSRDVVNEINVDYGFRYTRLHERFVEYNWDLFRSKGLATGGVSWADIGRWAVPIPTDAFIKEAVDSTDWQWHSLPTYGRALGLVEYTYPGATRATQLIVSSNMCTSCNLKLAKRWKQTMSEVSNIRAYAPQSIEQMGSIKEERSFSYTPPEDSNYFVGIFDQTKEKETIQYDAIPQPGHPLGTVPPSTPSQATSTLYRQYRYAMPAEAVAGTYGSHLDVDEVAPVNLLPTPENLTTWNKSGVTVTRNAGLGVEGAQTATRLTGASGSTVSYTIACQANTLYTFSVYIRTPVQFSGQQVYLEIEDTATAPPGDDIHVYPTKARTQGVVTTSFGRFHCSLITGNSTTLKVTIVMAGATTLFVDRFMVNFGSLPDTWFAGTGPTYRQQSQEAELTVKWQAKTAILASHRQNLVQIKTLLNPTLERFLRGRVNTVPVKATGKVHQITHEMDIEEGSALTSVTLAVSKIVSTTAVTPTSITTSSKTQQVSIPIDSTQVKTFYELGSYIGGLDKAYSIWDYSASGFAVTYSNQVNTLYGFIANGAATRIDDLSKTWYWYTGGDRYVLPTAAVESSAVDERTIFLDKDVIIEIPDEELLLEA